MNMTYNAYSTYSTQRRVLANIDKTSANNQSKVVRSPWGKFTHYTTLTLPNGTKRRMFAISESKVFHNGGNYTFRSIRERLMGID